MICGAHRSKISSSLKQSETSLKASKDDSWSKGAFRALTSTSQPSNCPDMSPKMEELKIRDVAQTAVCNELPVKMAPWPIEAEGTPAYRELVKLL